MAEKLNELVQSAISRANSGIRAEEELAPIMANMVGEAIERAEGQIKAENQHLSKVLSSMVDFALSRANSNIRAEEELQPVFD